MTRIAITGIAICLMNGSLLAQANSAKPSVAPPARVVFVCEHGTVKSLVALEYFNRLAAERGLRFEASSRGTRPDAEVPAVVRDGLKADGFDVRAFRSQLFTRRDVLPGTLVIALDASVDSVVGGRAAVARWDSLPSVMGNYSGGRAAIASRVQRLVDSLVAVKPR